VWVANEGDGTVTRINPRTLDAAAIDVGLRPRGIAANADAVWTSGYLASALQRIDPESARPAGRQVETALNPFKLALTGQTLWVVATGDGSVQRVEF